MWLDSQRKEINRECPANMSEYRMLRDYFEETGVPEFDINYGERLVLRVNGMGLGFEDDYKIEPQSGSEYPKMNIKRSIAQGVVTPYYAINYDGSTGSSNSIDYEWTWGPVPKFNVKFAGKEYHGTREFISNVTTLTLTETATNELAAKIQIVPTAGKLEYKICVKSSMSLAERMMVFATVVAYDKKERPGRCKSYDKKGQCKQSGNTGSSGMAITMIIVGVIGALVELGAFGVFLYGKYR